MQSNDLNTDTLAPTVDTGPGTSAPMALPLDFQGPTLHPAPVPDLSNYQPDPWAFLEFAEPIEDAAMLAFHVAALTVGMRELLSMNADLLDRVQTLEGTRNERSE